MSGYGPKPADLDPGDGTRADRYRMLKEQKAYWRAVNTSRRNSRRSEIQSLRPRQDAAKAYWDDFKVEVRNAWRDRTMKRGARVSDFPRLADQWDETNNEQPSQVPAGLSRPGQQSPYLWLCPFEPSHTAWSAWPKDRVQKGAGCPECRSLLRLSDIPSLVAEYAGSDSPEGILYRSNAPLDWVCRTWAADPLDGTWHRVEHHFRLPLKQRTGNQSDGCLVCIGSCIDSTNSLATWFPELAAELVEPGVDPTQLGTGQHNASRRDAKDGEEYRLLNWRCSKGHEWSSTVLNRVQGNGCPDCASPGISDQQIRLTAELAHFLTLDDACPPVSRRQLPPGISDLGSRRVPLKQHDHPMQGRYSRPEVDSVFLSNQGTRLGIEFDGEAFHSGMYRDSSGAESRKDQLLIETGSLDLLIRVRQGRTDLLKDTPALQIQVPANATTYAQAVSVLRKIEQQLPGSIPDLDSYARGGRCLNSRVAEEYIIFLREPGPPVDSRLTPTSRQSFDPDLGLTVCDYACTCGRALTRVSVAEVTTGRRRSCGCASDHTHDPVWAERPHITWTELEAWRPGLHKRGRVPDRLVATYLLEQAGVEYEAEDDGLVSRGE